MDIIKYNKTKEQQLQFLKARLNDQNADSRLLEWCGLLALENKHSDLAEQFFSCLLERRKKISDLFYLGEALVQQDRYQEAEECLLESIYQMKEPCRLLFNAYKLLGTMAMIEKNYMTAHEYYNKAYAIDPKHKSLQMNRSLLFIKEKKYKEAEDLLKDILKDDDKNTKAWMHLALARYKMGDIDMAKACLSSCLDLEPSNKQALYLKSKWDTSIPLELQFKYSA